MGAGVEAGRDVGEDRHGAYLIIPPPRHGPAFSVRMNIVESDRIEYSFI